MDTEAIINVLRQPLPQYYISVMLVMAPAVRIFLRAGLKPWPVALLLVPYIGYIFCAAYLCAVKWSRLKGGTA